MPQNGAGEAAAAPSAQSPQAAPGAAPPQAPKAAPDDQAMHAKSERDLAEARATLKRMETESADAKKADDARRRLEQERVRNPAKHLEELFGPDWYDVATKAKTGTVSPASVSSALDERERGLKAYLDEQLKPLKEENAKLRDSLNTQTKRDHSSQAATFAREGGEKYRLINLYKQADHLGGFIQGHHEMTGELWSFEQGAEALEKYWAGVRDMVLKCENGRVLADTLGTTPKPAATPHQNEATQTDDEHRRRVDNA